MFDKKAWKELLNKNLPGEQAQLRMKANEQRAFVEVKTAVRSVETDYLRIQAYKLARELAWRELEAEQEKLKVGLSTNYLVLLNQREYRNAQVQELRAVADYNLSLARLNRSMGLTLDEKNIRISGMIESRKWSNGTLSRKKNVSLVVMASTTWAISEDAPPFIL